MSTHFICVYEKKSERERCQRKIKIHTDSNTHVISLKAFSSGLAQRSLSHTHTRTHKHILMDTRVCSYPLIFHIHLLTPPQMACVWWHRCLVCVFCVLRVIYMLMNLEGHVEWCVCVWCVRGGEEGGGRSCYSWRTGEVGGEVEENLEDVCCFFVVRHDNTTAAPSWTMFTPHILFPVIPTLLWWNIVIQVHCLDACLTWGSLAQNTLFVPDCNAKCSCKQWLTGPQCNRLLFFPL